LFVYGADALACERDCSLEVIDDLVLGLESVRTVVGRSDLDGRLLAVQGFGDPEDLGCDVPDLQGVGWHARECAGDGGSEIVLVGRHLLRQTQDLAFDGGYLVVEDLRDTFRTE